MQLKRSPDLSRRSILCGGAVVTAASCPGVTHARSLAGQPPSPLSDTATTILEAKGQLAADEAHWARLGRNYQRTEGINNLEHGYWGRMAEPVLQHYQEALARVNREAAWYARRLYGADYQQARASVAELLGADVEEVALTRNATEAVHNVLRQYRGLGPRSAVLLADVDYPAFKRFLRWLKPARGVRVVTLELPPRATQDELAERYLDAFERNPDLRLALVTHASNQHGLVLPIARISAAARARGIHVLCDAAQSLGLLDFQVADLGCDWVAFNLHKWIGAPLGLGALYMRKGSLSPVAPYPGEQDPEVPDVQRRIHTGTWDFAAAISIPAAVDFHRLIGGKEKEARLRYLRSLWTTPFEGSSILELLGGAEEAAWSGIGSFRLPQQRGAEAARELQQLLVERAGIFSVPRYGLASGACVRITPQVFTPASDVKKLVVALQALS